MADIIMCVGTDCPQRESCKRYTAKANEYEQAYFTIPPIKDGKCDLYWGEKAEAIWKDLNKIIQVIK